MDTNPQAEVSPEAQLEAVFARQFGEQPKQEAQDEPEDEAPDEPEAEPEKAEKPEAEEDDGETVDDEDQPVKVGDKVYTKQELQEALGKSKDYTQKTQAVADQRRAVEEQQKALHQAQEAQKALFEKAVEIRSLEQQVQQYEQIDWAALAESDPAQAMKLNFAREALLRKQAKAVQEMQEASGKQRDLSAQMRQQALQRDAEILARDIKGWGPDLGRKIAEAGKSYGYSEAELEQVSARDIKVLHKAHLWDELQASKALTTKKVAEVKPVTVKAARSTLQNQSNSVLQEAKAKAQKSRSAEDTENYLAKLFESKRKR
jgi:hypothetical protein